MTERLTDGRIADMKVIFNLFDSENHDGMLTKTEMTKFLNILGVRPSKAELDEFFQMFDSDGKGTINFAEFLTLISRDET